MHVSAAPLLRLDFADRNPQLALGNQLRPTIIGDFADQTGVVLPSSYYTLTSTDPTIARVVRNQTVVAAQEGFAALVVTRGVITGATALVAGSPSQFDNVQLFTGLTVYPHAVTLVPDVGFKQLTITIDSGNEDVTAATSGILYYAGNSDVVSVGADGMIHGLAVGQADVTVVYKGVEFVVPVRVARAAGRDGDARRGRRRAAGRRRRAARDRTRRARLARATSASPRSRENALPMAMPAGWTYLGGYDLDFTGDKLSTPAQLAVQVPGLGRRRRAPLPAPLRPDPGRAAATRSRRGGRTRSRSSATTTSRARAARRGRASRLRASTRSPTGPSDVTLVRGILTVNFPIGIFPIAATLPGVMATFSPYFAVSFDVSSVRYVAIPKDGLPIVTDVGRAPQPRRRSTTSR